MPFDKLALHLGTKILKMSQLEGKIALVTGGASGIGKIMTRLLLERKSRVVVWDIDQVNLDKTITELSAKGEIIGFQVDLTDVVQIQESAKKVKQQVGIVDLIINNAGVVTGKHFSDHTTNDILKTMQVNANAPMLVTRAFLDDMIKKNSGHICNIASSAGLVSNPKMSVYVASKWSLVGWSDSLRLEMKLLKKNIKVTTIMPYYINTGMFAGVKSKIPILDPEKASSTIIKAIEKNKVMLTLPGWIYRISRLGQALFSINFFDWFAGTVMGIYSTMDNFIGRKN